MEGISSIIAGALDGSQPARRIPKEKPTLLEASSLPKSEEPETKYRIRTDEAKERGYEYTQEPPEPEKCRFCGNTLFYYGAIFPGQKRVITWFSEPEHCTCQKAQEYWKRIEAEKKAAEEEAAKRKEQERIQHRIGKLMKDSGLRGRFQNRTFERFIVTEDNGKAFRAAKRYADSFPIMLPTKNERGSVNPPEKERNGLFITGTKGTGKTHLAASIANQLIQGGTPVICMTMIDLLARIKQTFDREDNATEADVMRIYEEVPLLIIDDIGTEQPTEWGLSKIYAIINARYEAYMPTIVTTNYAGDDLIRRMTPDRDDGYTAAKTIDRLREMCAGIEMTGESWRLR